MNLIKNLIILSHGSTCVGLRGLTLNRERDGNLCQHIHTNQPTKKHSPSYPSKLSEQFPLSKGSYSVRYTNTQYDYRDSVKGTLILQSV